jgi:hypothetical protein
VIVVVTLAVVCIPFGVVAIWPLLVALAIELAAARLVRRSEFLRQGELWVFLGAQAMQLLVIAAGWFSSWSRKASGAPSVWSSPPNRSSDSRTSSSATSLNTT